jgi:DNA recombination protein RmuC
MAFTLACAAAVFSLVAAGFAVLTFLRVGRSLEPASPATALADTIRTEADRTRADAAEQARGLRQELGDTIARFQDSFASRQDAGIEQLKAPITVIGLKLDADVAKMGIDAAQNRDVLRQTIEAKLDASELKAASAGRELREELIGNFDKTSRLLAENMKGFGDSQHQRLAEVKKQIEEMSEKQAATGETLRQTVEGRLDVLRQENSVKLDEMRQTVDEKLQTALEKRLGESFRTVSEQLERVYAGLGEMNVLATGVGDLKKVLTNVKTRGTWGEIQLGMLLEQFLSPDQYIRNAQVKPGSAERVEFAVKFASRDVEGDLLLPIDAKFPHEDYERLVQAAERADAEGMEEAAIALEARVKTFAKTICEKYISPPQTTDFAILYLPTESLYAEVLRRTGLQEYLQREHRVTIAGPTTLAAMLNAFQMGFRSLAIQKRSSEVWQILGAVRAEFADHGKVVAKLQKQLGAASNTIEALGTRTKAMNRKLRDVETLPVSEAQAVLGLSAAVLAAEEGEDSEAAE